MADEAADKPLTITLGDKEHELRPSLAASRHLSRQAGGIREVINQVLGVNVDTIEQVISCGLGHVGQPPKELPELIYAAGYQNVVQPCIQYLTRIANGGKAPASAGGEEGAKVP